jgi:hypothetical protein
MNPDNLSRFFGGSPVRVLAQLVILSFIVGIVLAAFDMSPFDLVSSIGRLIRRIYDSGFETLAWVWRYFLLGAVVVFPIWLVLRLLRLGRTRGTPT